MTNPKTGEPARLSRSLWRYGHLASFVSGALQGITELFPVSSLAQTILLPAILGWNLGPNERERPDFLAFVVALHLATAIALFIYFWKDWKVVIQAFVGSAKRGRLIYDEASKIAWLLVAGTVVVGLLGLVFEKKLRTLFEDPKKTWIVAAVLVVNGFGHDSGGRGEAAFQRAREADASAAGADGRRGRADGGGRGREGDIR